METLTFIISFITLCWTIMQEYRFTKLCKDCPYKEVSLFQKNIKN